mgnify:CR=1 FL=1
MRRAWIGWMGALAWLVLLVGASGRAEAPERADAPGIRLERGALLRRFGAPDDPVEGGVWRYTEPGGTGRLIVVTIDPARARIGVLPSSAPRPLASLVAGERGDFVAINGGFYDEKNQAMGLVVSGGAVHARLRRGGGSGVFFVRGGEPAIVHRGSDLLRQPLDEALQSIDRLVDESEVLVRQRADLPRDARSAVAIDWRGRIHLVVAVDERAIATERDGAIQLGPESTTTGPTLWQLAEFLARPVLEGGLGARFALNLDGGFSTALQLRLRGERLAVGGYRGTINALVARPR